MKPTDQTLLEQMRITDFEVDHRKKLLGFTERDVQVLMTCRPIIQEHLDILVNEFYKLQTNIAEIALLIGDADTLARLRSAQCRYILDLFSGVYDLEYVNNRLRIGLVHKRIGVEPKLYLSAVFTLKTLLQQTISRAVQDDSAPEVFAAMDKLLLFDISLIFETYIRSMVSEIEIAREKSEQYAMDMEYKVKERTRQLEELSRTDALTGLLNVRYLQEIATTLLRTAWRYSQPLVLVYLDINDFKNINDTQGHQRGDEVLRVIGQTIKSITRPEDKAIRYGGDEFCVFLVNCRADQVKEYFVERFNRCVQEKLAGVSVSVGIAQTGPDEYMDVNTLIRLADKNMYTAKQSFKQTNGEAGAP